MNKNILIILLFLFSTISYGQKPGRLLNQAQSSINSEDYSKAREALKSVEAQFDLMKEKERAKYYYLKGLAYYSNGNSIIEDYMISIKNLNLAIDTENNLSIKYYTEKISNLKPIMANKLIDDARKALASNDDNAAFKNLEAAYRTVPSDTLQLYNAAIIATQGKFFNSAIELLKELIDLGFTGISTNYTASIIDTDEITRFQTKKMRDESVKTGLYENPIDEEIESVESSIYRTLANIYKDLEDFEKALSYITIANEVSPNDINIILDKADIYWNLNMREEYEELIKIALVINPNDDGLLCNLAILSFERKDFEKAFEYVSKALEIDGKNVRANRIAGDIILTPADIILDEMNSLGTSIADYNRYDELKIERGNIMKKAIPYYLLVYQYDNDNIAVLRTLVNIYSNLDDMDNYEKYKVIAEEIESKID